MKLDRQLVKSDAQPTLLFPAPDRVEVGRFTTLSWMTEDEWSVLEALEIVYLDICIGI